MSLSSRAFAIVLVLILSTAGGFAILFIAHTLEVCLPSFLFGWIPNIFALDGESAYDWDYLPFFLLCNGAGMIIYLARGFSKERA
jgi:hypothetical protein